MKNLYSTLKKFALLFFLLFSIAAFSQTIIKSQSFDSRASGYSDDLGYTVSSSTYVTVTGTTSESYPNSLRFSNNNGSNDRDSDVVFENVNISAFSNVSVTVSFKAEKVDDNEDLFLDISYDGGSNYYSSNSIKLVDGDDNNENIDWGSPDGDSQSVSSNPYTFSVPAGNNQIRIRIRATNLDNNEFFYVDNIVIKSDKYCRSYGDNTDGFVTGIRLVKFNTIDKSTPSEDNDYSDFTAISTTVTQGASYNLTVNLNTAGNYIIGAKAWIDWNQDGDFDDSGEEFNLGYTEDRNNSATSNSPLSITIPTTALEGNTRMRIASKWNYYPTSCETGFDGEVEDYTINIIASRTITTGTISPTSYCAGASVSIPYTKTGTFNAGNIFTAQLSDATGNFGSPVTIGTLSSIATGTISGTIPIGTVAGTGYRIRVVSSNPVVTGSTNVSNLTVNATSAAPAVGTITQPTCLTATGSVVLNGLPSGSWQLTRSPGNVITTGTGTSKTISELATGRYTYTVSGTGAGLKGEYFNSTSSITSANNPAFPTTSPTLTRTDATVNFDWVNGNPGAPINNDYFFVRWSGQIQPLYSQNYTFTTRSDDGVRLWVNGVQIINDWNTYAVKDNTGTISLTAGVKYDIVLEYYENTGQAVSKLYWNSTSQAKEIIPQSQLFPSAICGSPASADVVINAQPATPSVPIISSTAATCSAAGSTNISNDLSSNTYTFAPTGPTVGVGGLVSGMTIGTSYTVTSKTGTCTSAASGSFSNAAMLTTPSVPTISSTAATCSAAGSTNISNYFASNTYVFAPTGPTVGGGGLVSGMTIGTSYNVTSKTGTCTSAASGLFSNAAILVTPERPTVGKITQPDCVTPTGSVVLNDLPSSGTWYLYKTGVASPIVSGGSGTTYTVIGLTATTHTFTIKNSSGCTSLVSADVEVIAAITNTWDGIKWSDDTPTILQEIKFTEDYSIDTDVNGCSCKITGGKKVTIKSGKTMKIVNDVKVNGTLIFENNASLVQINDDAVNEGKIIYKRTTPEILKTGYVYWSSPVNGAALKAIQTGTLYYSFNGAGNSWVNANANTTMDTGKGYIVRGAGKWFDAGDITLTANFDGAPNNGVIPVTIVGAGKNNLIGNPYPSAIDGDAFINANSSIIEGTLYFWTHKSAIQLASGIKDGTAGSGAYAYTSNDYSPLTKVGGTNYVTGYIAAGQGFFARGSTTGGQAKFNNSMRLDGDKNLDNSGFLKPASASKTEKTTTTNKIEKNRIWLNLTNTGGAFKQMLLGYMTGATNNYDRGYDALSFNGNSFVNFYSINNTSLLTIQGRALPIQETDVVPLGYSSTIIGDFSISIDKTDGALSTMAVFLEDKLTNTTHNLKKGAYTFATEKGTFNDRFVLSYVDKVTLATDDFEVSENQIVITSKNKEININAAANYIDKVFVYDVTGKQIFLKSKIDKDELTISNIGNTDQVLIVKVLLQDNTIITKKIIF